MLGGGSLHCITTIIAHCFNKAGLNTNKLVHTCDQSMSATLGSVNVIIHDLRAGINYVISCSTSKGLRGCLTRSTCALVRTRCASRIYFLYKVPSRSVDRFRDSLASIVGNHIVFRVNRRSCIRHPVSPTCGSTSRNRVR